MRRSGNPTEHNSLAAEGQGALRSGHLWAIRLITVSAVVFIALASAVEADTSTDTPPNDEVESVALTAQSNDEKVTVDEPYTVTPPRMNAQETENSDADPTLEFTEASTEELTTPIAQDEVQVYRSQKFSEYHWQPDCLLAGEETPQTLYLSEAQKEGLIQCGVCRKTPAESEETTERRPKKKYLGNRSTVDNSWRRPIKKHWRESVETEWRLNSETNAAWRDGRH